jgi:glutamine amidotransferase-like uncharacterized protein
MKSFAFLAVLVALSGCATSPQDYPIPLLTPDGHRGFGMKGFSQFNSDEAIARTEIQGRFDQACGAPAKILSLHMERADSLIGVPHLAYDAVAECPN